MPKVTKHEDDGESFDSADETPHVVTREQAAALEAEAMQYAKDAGL